MPQGDKKDEEEGEEYDDDDDKGKEHVTGVVMSY